MCKSKQKPACMHLGKFLDCVVASSPMLHSFCLTVQQQFLAVFPEQGAGRFWFHLRTPESTFSLTTAPCGQTCMWQNSYSEKDGIWISRGAYSILYPFFSLWIWWILLQARRVVAGTKLRLVPKSMQVHGKTEFSPAFLISDIILKWSQCFQWLYGTVSTTAPPYRSISNTFAAKEYSFSCSLLLI